MSITPRHVQMPSCVIKPVFASAKLEVGYSSPARKWIDHGAQGKKFHRENTYRKFITTN